MIAIDPRFRYSSNLHARYLRFRWALIVGMVAAFMDAATSFVPLSTPHLFQAGLSLWVLGMAMAWHPRGWRPWWQDPDERVGDAESRWWWPG